MDRKNIIPSIKDSIRLLELRGFENMASNPVILPYLQATILDQNATAQKLRVQLRGVLGLKNIVSVMGEILHHGGWETFKIMESNRIHVYDDYVLIKP